MLLLTISKGYYVVGVHSAPLGKGYFSLILCPLPRGFEWFLFVPKNNSPGVSRGSKHGEANDKCIRAMSSIRFRKGHLRQPPIPLLAAANKQC